MMVVTKPTSQRQQWSASLTCLHLTRKVEDHDQVAPAAETITTRHDQREQDPRFSRLASSTTLVEEATSISDAFWLNTVQDDDTKDGVDAFQYYDATFKGIKNELATSLKTSLYDMEVAEEALQRDIERQKRMVEEEARRRLKEELARKQDTKMSLREKAIAAGGQVKSPLDTSPSGQSLQDLARERGQNLPSSGPGASMNFEPDKAVPDQDHEDSVTPGKPKRRGQATKSNMKEQHNVMDVISSGFLDDAGNHMSSLSNVYEVDIVRAITNGQPLQHKLESSSHHRELGMSTKLDDLLDSWRMFLGFKKNEHESLVDSTARASGLITLNSAIVGVERPRSEDEDAPWLNPKAKITKSALKKILMDIE
ncbi:hypothetical protein BC829DRAFT_442453 [Chytridium lagenaria]|nr:hypothetical protein BC829DRAFT_442453 [Chytridium lagenaria]